MSTYHKPLGNLFSVSAGGKSSKSGWTPFCYHTIAGRDSFLKQLCFDGVVIEDMEDG